MILAINTSTLQFGVALLEEDGTVVAECLISGRQRNFAGLMPAIHFLFSISDSDINNLNSLAIAIGPGSFTGIRVGLATAKGLCHSINLPIIGISSLKALASRLPYSNLPITPLIDSRKGELFVAQFVWDNRHNLTGNIKDRSLRLEDFPAVFKDPTVFIGNNFSSQRPLLKKMLGAQVILAPAHYWNLTASSVGILGLKRYHANDFDDPMSLNPIYMRSPDIRSNLSSPLSGPM